MYRLGQKRRTTKQLFALLRQKVYSHVKNRPKLFSTQMNHTDVVFPGDLTFKQKKQDLDYGDPSISKQDLPAYSKYLQYEFPLQNYQIKFDNNVLKLLNHQVLFQFTDEQLKGQKIECISSSNEYIVVGWSNGAVMIFKLDNIRNMLWMKLPERNAIKNIDIVGNNIVTVDDKNKFNLLEVLSIEMKILSQHQYVGGTIHMIKVRKHENALLVFISDSEGNLNKLIFKKTLFIQTSSIQLIYKTVLPLVFTLLNQKLSQKYKISKTATLVLAINNSVSCILASLDLSTNQMTTLYQYNNFVNFQPQNYNPLFKSVQFVEYEFENQETLMLASSFGTRLFFTNIQYNQQQQKFEFHNTRRIKYKQNIIAIEYIDGKKYLLLTESMLYYCLTANTTYFQVFKNSNQLKVLSLKINFPYSQSSSHRITYVNRKLIWVSQSKVQCCSVLNWQQLFEKISITQVLYLLYFLIVSRYVKSPYLQKPQTFKSLERSFPSQTIEQKQILLQYYYLMNQIPPDSLASNDELCQLLLPFIMNHQLDNLSNSQLEYLIKYWKEHQVLLVEEIIMSGIDKGWEIAIQNAWMRALMKIAKMGDDYEFPLLKMCGYFILNENNQELAGKYASQIIKYMSLGINKNLEQIDDEQEYDDMIKIFVKILLDKEMYLRLSKHQAKKVVGILTDLFRGESLNCLIRMPLEGFILSCTEKYYPLIMARSSVEEIIYSHCIGSLSRHYPIQISNNLICQQAVLMIDSHFHFQKERTLEVIKRLVIDEQLSLKATKLQYKPEVFERQELEIKSQQMILDLIQHLKNQHNLSSAELNQLLELSEKSRNLELVSIDLMKSQKRYQSILLKYVFSSKLGIKEKVFSWLEQTTKQLLKSQDIESEALKDLNRIVLNRMKELIHINKQKCRQYVQTYFKNSEKKLISRIQNDPQLQLQYVELVLQNQIVPDKELLSLHINLLCRLNSSRIIQVIEANPNRYDLQNVLEICLKYPNLDSVIIYLYQKTSDAEKAVAKHLELFLQEWQSMKKQRSNYMNKRNQMFQTQSSIANEVLTLKRITTSIDNKFQNSLKEITLHLEHILSIIHKQFNHTKQYYSMVTNLMSRILIVEEQQLEVTKSQDHTFLDKLTELLGIIIMDLARTGQIDFLVDDVLGKYKSMSLKEMKKHLKDVYSCMQSSETVLQNILEINRDWLLDLNVYTRAYVSKSNLALGICALCQVSIGDKQIALLFSCGHLYHLGCEETQQQQDYCSSCISSDVINGMIQNPDVSLEKLLINRQTKIKYRRGATTKEQVETQRRHDMAQQRKRDKLAIFDKKVSDIAIQSEIIELRLQSKIYRQ